MWVVDYNRVHDADGNDLEDKGAPPRRYGKLFAYGLIDGERDKTKEFVLGPDPRRVRSGRLVERDHPVGVGL